MIIERIPLSKLHCWEKNPRLIKDARFKALCKSIKNDPEFMELRPILATKKGMVYAGNMRLRAVEELGWKDVPCIITDISEKLAKERALKDNNNFGEYTDALNELIFELQGEGVDLETLGLTEKELQKILDNNAMEGIQEDEVPEVPKTTKIKRGDMFQLGEHVLLCGDATKKEDVERLMDGEKADMVFTDPPYGMDLDTDYTHMPESSIKSKRYDAVIGDDRDFDPRPILAFFADVDEQFWWGADYYYDKLPAAGSWIVWDKRSEASAGVIGNHFEVCWSKSKHRREVKRYHWVGFTAHDKGESRSHPTQKPVALVGEMIGAVGKPGDTVLDLFGGSGSTLIACEQLKRKCRMMEIDPRYCQVIVDRFENLTGKKAKLLK